MKSFQGDEGLSEVIGFILLIGLLVVVLVLYQTYSVPVQGRDNEIDHMNDVKDTLVAYKISLDSLWLNEREGTMLSTTLDLGTRGGYSRGGMGDIALLTPLSSGGSVGINQRDETITVAGVRRSSGEPISYTTDSSPGALEYSSNNNYWIDQNYYYQMGGIFLEQDSGSSVRVMPPLSITKYNETDPSKPETARLDFTIITLFNNELISGTGPVRIDTVLKTIVVPKKEEVFQNISVSVKSDDANTRQMWEKLFRDPLVQDKIDENWYTITNTNGVVTLDVTGNPAYGVYANIIRADYRVKFQTVATGIH
jgi:hypothetical protein